MGGLSALRRSHDGCTSAKRAHANGQRQRNTIATGRAKAAVLRWTRYAATLLLEDALVDSACNHSAGCQHGRAAAISRCASGGRELYGGQAHLLCRAVNRNGSLGLWPLSRSRSLACCGEITPAPWSTSAMSHLRGRIWKAPKFKLAVWGSPTSNPHSPILQA